MTGDAAANALPVELPLFPLNGVLLLPRGTLPLNVFEHRYLAMVDAALSGDRMIGSCNPQPTGLRASAHQTAPICIEPAALDVFASSKKPMTDVT